MEYRVVWGVEVGSIGLLAGLGELGWIVMVSDEDGWCCASNGQDNADDDLKEKVEVNFRYKYVWIAAAIVDSRKLSNDGFLSKFMIFF